MVVGLLQGTPQRRVPGARHSRPTALRRPRLRPAIPTSRIRPRQAGRSAVDAAPRQQRTPGPSTAPAGSAGPRPARCAASTSARSVAICDRWANHARAGTDRAISRVASTSARTRARARERGAIRRNGRRAPERAGARQYAEELTRSIVSRKPSRSATKRVRRISVSGRGNAGMPRRPRSDRRPRAPPRCEAAGCTSPRAPSGPARRS